MNKFNLIKHFIVSHFILVPIVKYKIPTNFLQIAITSAVVNFMILPSAPSEPVAPPVTDFSRDTNAERVETAGPIVFTHVDGWNKLSESEKRSQVETMAGHMGGFDGMFIIDEYGEVGAAWSPEKGVGVDSETP